MWVNNQCGNKVIRRCCQTTEFCMAKFILNFLNVNGQPRGILTFYRKLLREFLRRKVQNVRSKYQIFSIYFRSYKTRLPKIVDWFQHFGTVTWLWKLKPKTLLLAYANKKDICELELNVCHGIYLAWLCRKFWKQNPEQRIYVMLSLWVFPKSRWVTVLLFGFWFHDSFMIKQSYLIFGNSEFTVIWVLKSWIVGSNQKRHSNGRN